MFEPLDEPLRGLLRAPVLGEPPRQLLGRLLGPELGQLVGLLGKEAARLQLEQRREQHEELAAGFEVELVALGEPRHEGDDDLRQVELGERQLLAQHQRKQQVERPLEGIEVELKFVNYGGSHEPQASAATGRGLSGRPSSAAAAGCS